MNLEAALEKMQEEYRRSSAAWRPERNFASEYGRGWHDGYHTALAHHSLMASRALDPEGSAEADELWRTGCTGTDREWFVKTGCCGHCGSPGGDCTCTPDDPCGCGPHEPRTWPVPCSWCNGTGQQEPRVGRQS